MKKVIIYTDGACSGNPGPGGWGAVLMYNGAEKRISGFQAQTTNNRMELTAAIEALAMLNQACEVDLYSDSAYLINSFQQKWLEKWRRTGWKVNSKDVKNRDLWEKLYDFTIKHKVNFIKVKGHSDNEYNNICDIMAREEISRHKSQ